MTTTTTIDLRPFHELHYTHGSIVAPQWQYGCALRNLGLRREEVFSGDGHGDPDRESDSAWYGRGLQLNDRLDALRIEVRFAAARRRLPFASIYARIAPQHRGSWEV